ncbi:uncharacterized protein EAE98_001881 [Botrytis deweyae]|uniref:BBC1/AIM3 cysteine proteinase-fold domain-containing protein n=1 Tax=Botrytis deweyae TaxID=2478750 RepID=A0ABQ7IZ40_9HELO|nr:uncharacterized protein EAE98_001881 [Botrytis deweyae]KAF7937567.1 hypothetical protein EAE98_001881 [Botrytis deweyae]
MSGFKDTLKGGWHPKGKDGKSKESWKGDFKGLNQVAGWMGKGKDPREEALEHNSTPLSSLRDPASFGPPPKSVKYHGAAALPPPTSLSSSARSDTGGLGAPIPQSEIRAKQEAEEEERRRQEEEAAKPKPPPMPYRANTTGLSVSHLPPPPGRKDGADGRTPPMPPTAGKSKPPGLPPRLPPRQNSNPGSSAPSPPPTYGAATSEADPHKGILNQGALSRLGAAGVSVPGFGIGSTKAKPALPPPPPSRTSTNNSSPPPPPSRTSSPQLPARTSSPQIPSRSSSPQVNELQSRFSRLTSSPSLSSSSPKPPPPSEGTTFAQKQAALKTASAFHKDPSSISLSDARTAASTANNFRERHGEQVKSGWASANKLNTKYGIADKVGSYGGLSQGRDASTNGHDGNMENSSSPVGNGLNGQSVLGKKKPAPPPPPKKRSELGAPGNGAPPPIPMATKPKPMTSRPHPVPSPSPSQSQYTPTDLPLSLQTLWFAQSPPAFPPPSITSLPGTRSHASCSSWTSNGPRKTHTFIGVLRDNNNLSTTKIKLVWDASDPGRTVRAEQRHIAPPGKLGQRELELHGDRYGESVARWCEAQMGTQVGNGECWTLANEGLKAVARDCKERGGEGCMSSQGYVHGYKVFEFKNGRVEVGGGVKEAGVRRGDVVQFLEAHFMDNRGGQKWAGAPDHTSVVVGVKPNGVLEVVEQNVGGVKKVMRGEYQMAELVKGEVRIYRAVGESWVGPLDVDW